MLCMTTSWPGRYYRSVLSDRDGLDCAGYHGKMVMGLRHILVLVLAIAAGGTAIYGLHRLCLWMEKRGWLYYRTRKPGGGARSFIALQEFLEPPTRHVFHIEEHPRWHFEVDVPGGDEPPQQAEDADSGGDGTQPSSS